MTLQQHSRPFNRALHPYDPGTGQFVATVLTDSGSVLAPSPAEADLWMRWGFDEAARTEWSGRGFDVDEAWEWDKFGFLPGEALAFGSAGFGPESAREWRNQGLPVPPSAGGEEPPAGEGGPAELSPDQIAAMANPFADVWIDKAPESPSWLD